MDNANDINKIEVEPVMLKYLNTTRKWAMFLAIIGFIFLGLLLIIGLLTGTFLSAFSTQKLNPEISGPLLLIPLIIAEVVNFFPVLFLFRFSKHAAHAVQNLDKNELHKAFRNLKLFFVYIGILIIVGLVFYVAALIAAGSSVAFLRGF
jgi:hypothetical protein